MRSVPAMSALKGLVPLSNRLWGIRLLWGPGMVLAMIVLAIVLVALSASQTVLFRYSF
jgi:hypothetical protein